MENAIAFSLSRFPRIEMGNGSIKTLPVKIQSYGHSVLLITGKSSFYQSKKWPVLINALDQRQITHQHFIVDGEPSPDLVDKAVSEFFHSSIECVVAIGGGSVMDAGKAISGLLKSGDSVMDYLEGVGLGKTYQGPAVPFIAVPTTAGTGSEATKNAVLSKIGVQGFKKSFRDEQLIPEYALVDPDLLDSCPKPLIAANGMDAFTQLLESYVSIKANPFTDALALSGIESVRDSLLYWYECETDSNLSQQQAQKLSLARAHMAYAALLSGITLAQVGLGSVHGLASPLGAFFPIPHGIACGTMLADATRINIDAMQQREPNNRALERYAQVGRLMLRQSTLNTEEAHTALIQLLQDWTQKMHLEPLSAYGVTEQDVQRLVTHSRGNSMKTNPIVLTDDEIERLIRARLGGTD